MRAIIIKSFLIFCAAFPLRISHAIGTFIGMLLTIFPNDIRHITRVNLEICFSENGRDSVNRLVRKSLIETGKTVVEMGALWYWQKKRILACVKEIIGEDILTGAFTNNQGVILAIPHLGSWEIVGLYCSANYPMTSMYRMPRVTALDPMMRSARERFGATLVTAGISGIRALHKALTKGELVAILPDQEPSKGNGMFVPFFGTPAYTMSLLPKLARSSGATIIYAFAERLPKGEGFRLHFRTAPDQIDADDETIALSALNKGIEQCIQLKPEQYQWNYKRFRTRPDGESNIY